MPTLKEYIEEREKELKKKFKYASDMYILDIAFFLRQSLLAYAKLVREEIKNVQAIEPGSNGRFNACNDLLSSPLLDGEERSQVNN